MQHAKGLRQRVIAEGVETLAQLEFLRKQGGDEIQGYYFSKPLAANEFERKILQGTRLNTWFQSFNYRH